MMKYINCAIGSYWKLLVNLGSRGILVLREWDRDSHIAIFPVIVCLNMGAMCILCTRASLMLMQKFGVNSVHFASNFPLCPKQEENLPISFWQRPGKAAFPVSSLVLHQQHFPCPWLEEQQPAWGFWSFSTQIGSITISSKFLRLLLSNGVLFFMWVK